MSILISICTRESIGAQTVFWLLRAKTPVDIVCTPWSIDQNRNEQVRRFLKTDFTHLFMLDSDSVPAPGTLEVLQYHEKDAIVAPNLILDRGLARPMAYVKNGDITEFVDPKGIQVIESSGMSGLLVRREVLKAIPQPWFQFEYLDDHVVGEDFYFYRKLHQAGFELWCDFSLVQRHIRQADLKEIFDAQSV